MASAEGPATPAAAAGSGAAELLVRLKVSSGLPPGRVTLACASRGGTTVAVLDVEDPVSERVSDILEVLSQRLGALLAESGDGWTQKVRLAYPDGTPLSEPDDLEATVADLVASAPWLDAVANEGLGQMAGGVSVPSSPSGASSPAHGAASPSGSSTRKGSRADSRSNRVLENHLSKLREAKHLPLTAGGSTRERQQEPSTQAALPEVLAEAESESGKQAAAQAQAQQAATIYTAPLIEVPPGGDLAARAAGGRVLMTSSLDMAHPAENVIDGSEATYWISTGLYPQEILLELCRPAKVSGVRLSSTNVRNVRIEGCSEDSAVSFRTLVVGELECREGQLKMQELSCVGEEQQLTRFVKAVILSGWDDFCSVHRLVVF